MDQYKYKYNKYLLKMKKLDIQQGGGSQGCCINSCGRNANQFKVIAEDIVNSICCNLCEIGIHTFECNERQRAETLCICGCNRFVECGIDMRSGRKFLHCCNACETTHMTTHTPECETKYTRITHELTHPYQTVSALPILPKLKSGKPLDKSQIGEFNETFRTNNMPVGIIILRNRLAELDGVNESVRGFVVRVLHNCSQIGQTDENIRAGIDFFTELFLAKNIFLIDEAVASIGLRLMMLGNMPKDYILRFTEKIFGEIEITRRVFTSLFALCAERKDTIFTMELLRLGIIKNIIFTNEDYEYILDCINVENPNKKLIALEIITYMESQDYLEVDGIKPITPKTVQILHNIFENTANPIVDILGSTCLCPKCKIQLKQFNLDTTEKQNILDFMEQSQSPQFRQMIDYIKANPANFIIDGANVGYQEKIIAKKPVMIINYHKIDMILKKITGDVKVIIFLHNRHQKNLTPQDKQMIDKWTRGGVKLCWTPFNMNDDISWMYATLYNDCLLISNDEMRDHYVNIYSKVSPVNFKLWKELHQISHGFSTGDIVTLGFPPRCLSRIQHTGNIWHFPLGRNKWMCLDSVISQ